MSKEFAIRSLGPCQYPSAVPSRFLVDDATRVLLDATTTGCYCCKGEPASLELAGPRAMNFFDPPTTRAAIVTCGGLCPGLNDVIRGIVMVLWYRYGVTSIEGLRYGYEGLIPSYGHKPLALTPEIVADIHQNGGTILGSSRGNQNVGSMVDFLVERKIDILFAVGGDGTQRGALEVVNEIERRGLKIAVVGIPKTIDNDILFTDRTFGFETAVASSEGPIDSAHMEAKGAHNGVGLVKLMGRDSGFVAAYATLASSNVNLVLIPEVPFRLENVLAFLDERLARKAHAVVVVAEGAGQNLVLGGENDASGNRKFGDIGLFMQKAIRDYFAAKGQSVPVRYIDPSYMIRSSAANADDSVFCFQLSERAVHAAMSGRTGLIIGEINGHFAHVPMEKAVAERKKVNPFGILWQSVLDNTGQPANLM
jgi:6-phosphofructokinase 1